jgi:hypothetical protein
VDRLRLSAGVDYALRLMRVYTDLVGGDPTTALVFIAAAQASTQHVNPKGDVRQNDTFIRDELRRPITLSALARSLGLPVETTRRHVVRLAKRGLVARTEGGGVIVTSQELDSPEVRAAVLANNVNVSKLLAVLSQTP